MDNQVLAKLPSYAIRQQELAWFTSYLFERCQLAEIEGSKSNEKSIFNVVPQGSILGPLLFISYFDDISISLVHSCIVMYADDAVIYHTDKNIREIKRRWR